MDRSTLIAAVVADRISGMKYKVIAARHDISVPLVRQLLTQAVEQGVASHDQIHYRPGTPPPVPNDVYDAEWVQRVLTNIRVSNDGCWIWQGRTGTWGYGSTGYRGRDRIIHRQFYQVVNRVKLDRWQLVMHKCDQRLCINPMHLQIGTPGDNVLDAAAKGRHHNARKTHCKRGHEFTPENTWIKVGKKGNVMRGCLTCQKAAHEKPEYIAWRREYQRRRRAEKKATKVRSV